MPPALEELPPVGRTIEHPAVSRRRGGSGGWDSASLPSQSTRCRACRTTLALPASRISPPKPTPGMAPRPLRGEDREDLTPVRSDATSIERCISTTDVSRHLPRTAWHVGHSARSRLAPLVLPPEGLALRPFTATIPCCFWQARLFRLGPRSRPRILLIAVASLGQTQPLDFCNEFSNTTHEHMPASAVLARRRGWPCERCRVRRALHAALTILFLMQRWVGLVHRRELREFPDTRARDPDPEGP